MTDLTPEMIAAGAAVMEEHAGGDYLRWRQAAVRVWVEMNRAKAGPPPIGGETFMLAYQRNLAKAKELADEAVAAEEKRLRMIAAAKEHGLAIPDDDGSGSAEREWQEWLAVNG